MSIESFKTWQWVVIGAIVGFVIAAVRIQTGATSSLDDRPGLSLAEFVELASLPVTESQPTFHDLTIYPAVEGKNFITGEYRQSGFFTATKYIPFQLNAPVPFRIPRGPSAPSPTFTVRDYIAQANPSLSYRYVWYASDSAQLMLWTAGSALVVGGIWPLVLRLLVGAGYGRKAPPEPAYDLDRFSHGEVPSASAAAKPPVSDEDAARLTALQQALEAQLGASETTGPTAPAPEQPAPAVVTLSNAPFVPEAGPQEPEEAKDYKGEFYPVARSGPKSDVSN